MRPRTDRNDAASDFLQAMNKRRFRTILADPPWQFTNRTGKMAPEHRRLARYVTVPLEEIRALPVGAVARADAPGLAGALRGAAEAGWRTARPLLAGGGAAGVSSALAGEVPSRTILGLIGRARSPAG